MSQSNHEMTLKHR